MDTYVNARHHIAQIYHDVAQIRDAELARSMSKSQSTLSARWRVGQAMVWLGNRVAGPAPCPRTPVASS